MVCSQPYTPSAAPGTTPTTTTTNNTGLLIGLALAGIIGLTLFDNRR